MTELQNITYSMNSREFIVMLLLKDVKNIYGISVDTAGISDKCIIETLYGMAKKNMLNTDNGEFIPDREYDVIFGIIKNAGKYITIYPMNTSRAVCFCYVGEKTVVIKKDAFNTELFHIDLIENSCFVRYFDNLDYLPPVISGDGIADETAYEEYISKPPDADVLMKKPDCKFIIVCEDKNNTYKDIISVNSHNPEWYMDRYINGIKVRQKYVRSGLEEYMNEMLVNGR